MTSEQYIELINDSAVCGDPDETITVRRGDYQNLVSTDAQNRYAMSQDRGDVERYFRQARRADMVVAAMVGESAVLKSVIEERGAEIAELREQATSEGEFDALRAAQAGGGE